MADAASCDHADFFERRREKQAIIASLDPETYHLSNFADADEWSDRLLCRLGLTSWEQRPDEGWDSIAESDMIDKTRSCLLPEFARTPVTNYAKTMKAALPAIRVAHEVMHDAELVCGIMKLWQHAAGEAEASVRWKVTESLRLLDDVSTPTTEAEAMNLVNDFIQRHRHSLRILQHVNDCDSADGSDRLRNSLYGIQRYLDDARKSSVAEARSARSPLEAFEAAKRLMYCESPSAALAVALPYCSICVISPRVRSPLLLMNGLLQCSAGRFTEAMTLFKEDASVGQASALLSTFMAIAAAHFTFAPKKDSWKSASVQLVKSLDGQPGRSFAAELAIAVLLMLAAYSAGELCRARDQGKTIVDIFDLILFDVMLNADGIDEQGVAADDNELVAWWAIRELSLWLPRIFPGERPDDLLLKMRQVEEAYLARKPWFRPGLLTASRMVQHALSLSLNSRHVLMYKPTAGKLLEDIDREEEELAKVVGLYWPPGPTVQDRYALQQAVHSYAKAAGSRVAYVLNTGLVSTFLWEVGQAGWAHAMSIEAEVAAVTRAEEPLVAANASAAEGVEKVTSSAISFALDKSLVKFLYWSSVSSPRVLECILAAFYIRTPTIGSEMETVTKAMVAVMQQPGAQVGRLDALCRGIPEHFSEEESGILVKFFDFLHAQGRRHHADSMMAILIALARNGISVTDEQIAAVGEMQWYVDHVDDGGERAACLVRYGVWAEGLGQYCDLLYERAVCSERPSAWEQCRRVLGAVLRFPRAKMGSLFEVAEERMMVSYVRQLRQMPPKGASVKAILLEVREVRERYSHYGVRFRSDLYNLELLCKLQDYTWEDRDRNRDAVSSYKRLAKELTGDRIDWQEILDHFEFKTAGMNQLCTAGQVLHFLFFTLVFNHPYIHMGVDERRRAEDGAVAVLRLALAQGESQFDGVANWVEKNVGKAAFDRCLKVAEEAHSRDSAPMRE